MPKIKQIDATQNDLTVSYEDGRIRVFSEDDIVKVTMDKSTAKDNGHSSNVFKGYMVNLHSDFCSLNGCKGSLDIDELSYNDIVHIELADFHKESDTQ